MSWAEDEALRCVKCGFCLEACPTYQAWGQETQSPRGRLAVIRALFDGELSAAEAQPALDPCLGCRACEPVCPSGIEYGRVLETARSRAVSEHAVPGGPVRRHLTAVGLRHLLPYPKRLRALASGLKLLRRMGAEGLAARFLPAHLGRIMRATPEPSSARERRRWGAQVNLVALPGGAGWRLPATGSPRYRVAFFPGCIMDALFWSVNRATLTVLQRTGCEVIIPAASCCGALHAHSGDHDQAAALARQSIAALAAAEGSDGRVDAIISNAGGCGAHMVAYDHLLGAEGQEFTQRVKDLSEWLDAVGIGSAEFGPVPAIATYQESCHLANGQKVRAQPRRLLAMIPELNLVELAEAAYCCGSAGIYNLTHPDLSAELLTRKVTHIQSSGAELVITANPGCHLQIRAGLQESGKAVQVLHMAELLALSLGG